MDQPGGFVVQGQESKVCKLRKSLYGLKQAPKQWHEKIDNTLISNGFVVNESDRCVYNKFSGDSGVIICLYVDDMLILGTDMDVVKSTKDLLSSNFDMKDLGEADVILGIKIIRNSEGITLSQSHYVEKVLKKFNNFDCVRLNLINHLVGFIPCQFTCNTAINNPVFRWDSCKSSM